MDQQGATRQTLTHVLTTGQEGARRQEPVARALAARYGLRFTTRRERSLVRLHLEERADIVGVLTEPGFVLYRGEQKLAFTTGMAEVRIQRVQKGEHEPLLKLGSLGPGLRVLDCTLGLARDALVMAASGAEVDGVESVALLAAQADAGLARLTGAGTEAAKRVHVVWADYRDVLATAADASYDVVYLDPMFEDDVQQGLDYQFFRTLADPRPIDLDAVHQARRVARGAVIIKDGPSAKMLKLLGLPLRDLTMGHRVRFGVLDPLPTSQRR